MKDYNEKTWLNGASFEISICQEGGCSTAVEQAANNQEVVGSKKQQVLGLCLLFSDYPRCVQDCTEMKHYSYSQLCCLAQKKLNEHRVSTTDKLRITKLASTLLNLSKLLFCSYTSNRSLTGTLGPLLSNLDLWDLWELFCSVQNSFVANIHDQISSRTKLLSSINAINIKYSYLAE